MTGILIVLCWCQPKHVGPPEQLPCVNPIYTLQGSGTQRVSVGYSNQGHESYESLESNRMLCGGKAACGPRLPTGPIIRCWSLNALASMVSDHPRRIE